MSVSDRLPSVLQRVNQYLTSRVALARAHELIRACDREKRAQGGPGIAGHVVAADILFFARWEVDQAITDEMQVGDGHDPQEAGASVELFVEDVMVERVRPKLAQFAELVRYLCSEENVAFVQAVCRSSGLGSDASEQLTYELLSHRWEWLRENAARHAPWPADRFNPAAMVRGWIARPRRNWFENEIIREAQAARRELRRRGTMPPDVEAQHPLDEPLGRLETKLDVQRHVEVRNELEMSFIRPIEAALDERAASGRAQEEIANYAKQVIREYAKLLIGRREATIAHLMRLLHAAVVGTQPGERQPRTQEKLLSDEISMSVFRRLNAAKLVGRSPEAIRQEKFRKWAECRTLLHEVLREVNLP